MSDAESPEMLRLVQRVTTAYLRHALGLGDDDWAQEQRELANAGEQLGRLESK